MATQAKPLENIMQEGLAIREDFVDVGPRV